MGDHNPDLHIISRAPILIERATVRTRDPDDSSLPLIIEAESIIADDACPEDLADVMLPLFVRDAHAKGRIRLSDIRDLLCLIGLDGHTEIEWIHDDGGQ